MGRELKKANIRLALIISLVAFGIFCTFIYVSVS
tara:strand:+ start:178 stop:279 length:102 start_codon:yes stop_codon:yes gene_type:complete